MPHPATAASSLCSSYQQLLYEMTESTMAILRRVAADAKSEDPAPVFTFHYVVRHQAVLCMIVRRAVVVSQYLADLPAPAEERRGQIMAALDSVLDIFAANKIDAGAYDAALNAEIDGRDDPDDDLDDEDELEPEENADVPGRPPAALVAELCRDLGLAMDPLPEAWLEQVPSDLRLLCARAAIAAIRPSASSDHRPDS